jgi:dTDP-4-dehydrorhamnose 3,5-epimerase
VGIHIVGGRIPAPTKQTMSQTSLEFKLGPIEGVLLRNLKRMDDARGWLAELFRRTNSRGNLSRHVLCLHHQARNPTGPSRARRTDRSLLLLRPIQFSNRALGHRPGFPTYRNKISELVGQDHPAVVIVPPGVVHTYKNVGREKAWSSTARTVFMRGEIEKKEWMRFDMRRTQTRSLN